MRTLLAVALLAFAAGCRSVSTTIAPVVTVYQYGDGKVAVGTDYTRDGDDSQAADKAVTPSLAASAATGPSATSGEASTVTSQPPATGDDLPMVTTPATTPATTPETVEEAAPETYPATPDAAPEREPTE